MRQYASAGAIVVTTDLRQPRTLLLDQVRVTGERQTVAAKGRLEPGEAPLAAALREVAEEAGLHDVIYAGYLGQQAYRFTDNDGTPAAKTVDWFLFAADDTTALTRGEEGFTTARWIDLDTAGDEASHAGFGEYLRRAADIVSWRQHRPLPFSTLLDRVIRDVADQATAILAEQPDAGVGVCGSAARGDYVEGWSDIDLIGWGLPEASPLIAGLSGMVEEFSACHGIRVSLRLADEHGHDVRSPGPVPDMKLQAALRRVGTDVAVIAGVAPATAPATVELLSSLELLHEHAAHGSTRWSSGRDRDRRLLSIACSTARIIVTNENPDGSLRLPDVVRVLECGWPSSQLGALLGEYDTFRRAGAESADTAAHLARRVPDALTEMIELGGSVIAAHKSPSR
ncbi:NUDIX domain-containing protein [Dactylosporangium sp. NPDC000555]|uniref:NUDIX domain-containing protein n=1 Tax=Dactylosporangium sp. NPDC000555 TaxID=3154260 RepID=UPI00331EACB2